MQTYVSRFQDRLCVFQSLQSTLDDYRDINEGEELQIILKKINIKDVNTLLPYDLSLESISFRKMLGSEITLKCSGSDEIIISSIDTDDDTTYYLPHEVGLNQGDTILIKVNQGRWRLNGFEFNVSLRDFSSNRVKQYQNTINVIPNPAHDRIFIKGAGEDDHISIKDIQGRIVYSGYQNIINIETFFPGMYFIETKSSATKFLVN